MPHQFIFLCPVCQSEDPIEKKHCRVCGAEFTILEKSVQVNDSAWDFPQLLRWMKEKITVAREETIADPVLRAFLDSRQPEILRISGTAILRQGSEVVPFTGFSGLFRRSIESSLPVVEGRLLLAENTFFFISQHSNFEFQIKDVTCVTTNGHYFEFRIKGEKFFQVRFDDESPLKYEIIFRKYLSDFYRRNGKRIIEFQPRLRFTFPDCNGRKIPVGSKPPVSQPLHQRIVTELLRKVLWFFLRLWIHLEISGKPNLPAEYPFIALFNHQSIFDPFIVTAFLDKRIAFLTKSTSFSRRFERYVLRIGRGIPTTRYRTDPSVVRHILLFLERGIPVGIFPEGERSWDGELQDFKVSVIRILTALRVPIVPVINRGSFEFMPRWAKFPRRQTVSIDVRGPFCLMPDLYSCEELKKFLELQFRR